MESIFKISEMIDEKKIIDIKSDDKKSALNELLEIICKDEKITDEKIFRKEIFKREKLMSTGIGYGIAIPHARHKTVKDFVIALGRKKQGLEYESIDDKPVQLIFMIGASDNQDKDYIKVLSRLVLRLKNPEFVEKVLNAENSKEIYQIIKTQR
ncbi:MAG TPA: PTS sugar transporter subunit IIA [Candidatus Cloacimonetes bacterium]|nr:PTS sugar transporter subunit IIA [Candidatus Cloacimonadota bacterium]